METVRRHFFDQRLVKSDAISVRDFITDIVWHATDIKRHRNMKFMIEEPWIILLALVHLPNTPKYNTLIRKYRNLIKPNGLWNIEAYMHEGKWLGTLTNFKADLHFAEVDWSRIPRPIVAEIPLRLTPHEVQKLNNLNYDMPPLPPPRLHLDYTSPDDLEIPHPNDFESPPHTTEPLVPRGRVSSPKHSTNRNPGPYVSPNCNSSYGSCRSPTYSEFYPTFLLECNQIPTHMAKPLEPDSPQLSTGNTGDVARKMIQQAKTKSRTSE